LKTVLLVEKNKKIIDDISKVNLKNYNVVCLKDANYLIPYLEEFIPSYVILPSNTTEFEKLSVYINESTNCELIITCKSMSEILKNPFQNIVVNKPENLKDFKKILGIIDKIESEKKIKSGKICKRYDNYRFVNQQVISFYSIQGGIGKTTLAFNLAYHLTNLQEVKILIIDLNFCEGPSDLSINLNLSLTPNLSLFIEKITEGFSALSKSIVKLNGFSVDILQPPLSIHQSDKFSIDMLDQLLYLARSHYNFIIVDIPFRYNNVSLEMLNLSTTVVFVLSTDISAIIRLSYFLKFIPADQKKCVVINKIQNKETTNLNEIKSMLSLPVYLEIPFIPGEKRRLIGKGRKKFNIMDFQSSIYKLTDLII
jgi:MinD-like ATPase involved in chromosome partitioning or flagellar assembly